MKPLTLAVCIVILAVLIVGTCGCTSNTSNTSNTSTPALDLSAHQESTPANITSYYGANVVTVNATISNNNAGTFKISSDSFYLQDSSGQIHQPLNTVGTAVSDSGYENWMVLRFQIKAGSTVTQLRYFDGTHDINCAVS